jgi:hypothetical protein
MNKYTRISLFQYSMCGIFLKPCTFSINADGTSVRRNLCPHNKLTVHYGNNLKLRHTTSLLYFMNVIQMRMLEGKYRDERWPVTTFKRQRIFQTFSTVWIIQCCSSTPWNFSLVYPSFLQEFHFHNEIQAVLFLTHVSMKLNSEQVLYYGQKLFVWLQTNEINSIWIFQ